MSNYKAVVIGGSAGSFQLVLKILSVLPKDFRIPVFFALHRSKEIRKGFAEALSMKSNLTVVEPLDSLMLCLDKQRIFSQFAQIYPCLQ